MDETLQRIAVLLCDTFLPLVLGYALHRVGLVSKRGTQLLMVFNVRVIFTLLACVSFWKLRITASLIWLPVLGVFITLLPYFVFTPLTRKMQLPPLDRGALITAGMLGNTGTLGGLVCFLLMGPMAYAYVQIVAVIQNVILILFNFPVAQHYYNLAHPEHAGTKSSKLHFFLTHFFTWNQISLVGMLIGIALAWYDVPQPDALTRLFGPLVHISSWIAFLPVGLLLNFEAVRKYFRLAAVTMPVKFVFLPLLIWAIGMAFIDDPVQRATLVIISATPSAINSVITTELYGLNTDVAIAAFCVTTIAFLLFVCPFLVLTLKYL